MLSNRLETVNYLNTAIFLMQAMLPWDFLIFQITTTKNVNCLKAWAIPCEQFPLSNIETTRKSMGHLDCRISCNTYT